MVSNEAEKVAVPLQDRRVIGVAKSCSRLNKRVENPRQIEGCTANDFEHVGRSGLLLERLPQLVEQTRVLDSDDGLACKIFDQLDLLVGEWAHLLAVDYDRSN